MASVTSTPMPARQSNALFDSMTQLVPPGHEKPLKQAFYTAAALVFVAVICAAAVSVYLVLQIFIQPLLWAVLCGSFLFPFKYKLNSILGSWLTAHAESGRPLILGAIFIPLSAFDGVAEKLGHFVVERWKLLFAILAALAVLYVLYLVQLLSVFFWALVGLWKMTVFLWYSISVILEVCAEYRIVIITIVGAYLIAALMCDPSTVPFLEYAAVPAWILLSMSLVSVAGSLQVPFGLVLIMLIITGAVSARKRKRGELTRSILERTGSITALLSPSSTRNQCYNDNGVEDIGDESVSENDEKKDNHEDDNEGREESLDSEVAQLLSTPNESQEQDAAILQPSKAPASAGNLSSLRRRRSRRNIVTKSASTTFFELLFSACALAMVWIHVWLVVLLVIPFAYWLMKKMLCHDVVRKFLEMRCQNFFGCDVATMKSRTAFHLQTRKDVLLPGIVRSMWDLIIKGDKKFNSAVLLSLPTVTSIIMILILIVGSVSISIFFAVKVQQESFLMLQMTSDLINETVSNHPEYQAWLPDNDTMQKSMDSLVDKVYLQGRGWIKDQIHANLGKDANVTLVEKQALRIWDRAYHSWFSNKTSVVNERKLLRRQSTENLQSEAGGGLFSGVMDLLNMSEVIELLKENMSALKSVLESVWSVLQSNITLIFSSITTLLTILMSGGTAILNFVLSTVIFFTALFYLLAGSENQYMPVRLIGFGHGASAKPSPIGTAIQDAISGVFGASLKMAGFYGLYTWLNHITFGAILVYIPSLLAAVFSVVPVFTTYWACIPAFLEIWLLQGSLLRAFALLFFQFLPTMFVDAEIYAEMSASGGGHPYVTGLAVAGGLYYFGLQGVIIGPILLCILLVAINVSSQIIALPSTPRGPLFKRTTDQ